MVHNCKAFQHIGDLCFIYDAGTRWATDSVKLVTLSHPVTNETNIVEIVDYDTYVPTMSLSLQDYYGQEVVIESDHFAQLTVATSLPQDCITKNFFGYIGGGIVEKFKNGVATFAEVDAFCAPEGVMHLNGISDLVMNSTVIELNFRPCVVGGKLVMRERIMDSHMLLYVEHANCSSLCFNCFSTMFVLCCDVCRVLRGSHLLPVRERDLLLH